MYSVVCHHISVTKEKGITLEDGDDDSDDDGGEEDGDDDEEEETVDRIIFSSFLHTDCNELLTTLLLLLFSVYLLK